MATNSKHHQSPQTLEEIRAQRLEHWQKHPFKSSMEDKEPVVQSAKVQELWEWLCCVYEYFNDPLATNPQDLSGTILDPDPMVHMPDGTYEDAVPVPYIPPSDEVVELILWFKKHRIGESVSDKDYAYWAEFTDEEKIDRFTELLREGKILLLADKRVWDEL